MQTETLDTIQPRGDSFGERLRQLRTAAGLTQEELASRSGLTAKAISVLERGERLRPYPHTVRALADALDLSDAERASLFAAVPVRRHGASPVAQRSAEDTALPWPSTPLLGRERELKEISILLRERRLLTLTGTAGVGKTRLAVEVARDVERRGGGRAVFVPLAPLNDVSSVLPAMAQALGARESGRRTVGEALRAALREQRLFVVLDNFEHVLGAAAEVAELLEACPQLSMLATSRAPLRVRGEQEYPVPPLVLPRSTVAPSVEEVLGSAAGRLFVDRAQAAFPGFALTPQNASAVAAICWRLAGLPLALELVAPRVRFLDTEVLLTGLDQALSRSWVRDVAGRHRTMWAALDWSHDLLPEAEQIVFRRLAVFGGGFSLQAAEAVGVSEGVVAEGVAESLGTLVEQSLVVADHDKESGGLRYGMLEPVRQYAREKLEESGANRDAEQRHLAYFLDFAEHADRNYGLLTGTQSTGTAGEVWVTRLDREHDNLRAALHGAKKRGDVANGLRLAGAMGWFWWMRGYCGEGRLWIETFLEMAAQRDIGVSDQVSARALLGGGMLALGQGDLTRSTALLEESLTTYRRHGDSAGIAAASAALSCASRAGGDDGRAQELSEEALRVSRGLGDDRSMAISFSTLGHIARRNGDLPQAITLFREARALFEHLGERRGIAYSLCNLGLVALESGEADLALELYEESILLYDTLQDEAGRGYVLIHLGDVARFLGKNQRAVSLYEEALEVLRKIGAERGIARALARLGAERR